MNNVDFVPGENLQGSTDAASAEGGVVYVKSTPNAGNQDFELVVRCDSDVVDQ